MLHFVAAILCFTSLGMATSSVQAAGLSPEAIVQKWYTLSLALIRHTPTYSPPVASRSLAYLGVATYEAVASGSDRLQSMAGQLNGLDDFPRREQGQTYNDAIVIEAALSAAIRELFSNTGPSGQQAIARLSEELRAAVNAAEPDTALIERSTRYGEALAAHILDWSRKDGGAVIENMGFPWSYDLKKGPEHWVPTNPLSRQQQMPLLPNWGNNRPFAMPANMSCAIPAPLAYSEDKNSDFYREAMEVYTTSKSLTSEQKAIAFFWTDDAMATPTPAGHWISIVLQIASADHFSVEKLVDVLMRLSVGMADAFIGCWHEKFRYDLLRPITYIKRVMDPEWMPFLLTPPFPEYPSGHSVQSAAAATVLAAVLGDPYPFTDKTRERDGAIPRSFTGFIAAAKEAGLSRLYGGIHFRRAIEQGYEQGRCIGAYAVALKTQK